MTESGSIEYTSSNELLDQIFEQELLKPDLYDQEIVALFKKHLGQSTIHSEAGKNLAEDLIFLAKHRVEEGRR